jgi:hypothetical protein
LLTTKAPGSDSPDTTVSTSNTKACFTDDARTKSCICCAVHAASGSSAFDDELRTELSLLQLFLNPNIPPYIQSQLLQEQPIIRLLSYRRAGIRLLLDVPGATTARNKRISFAAHATGLGAGSKF